MKPSAPPSNFLEVGIPILSLATVSFDKFDAYIEKDAWDIDIKAGSKENDSIVSIVVTLKCLIDENKHAVHVSKTIFATKGLTFDNLQPGDPRLEVLTELSLSAIGHARAFFFTLTREFEIPPFIMVFTNEIRKVVAREAKTII